MALIERAIRYLENDGRADRSRLTSRGMMIFAAESMRFSTQLMQAMAWLMVQKAVRQGEITTTEAASPKHRLGAHRVCESDEIVGAEFLPDDLRHLMTESRRLYHRISRLDQFVFGRNDEITDIPPELPPPPVERSAVEANVLPLDQATLLSLRAERVRHRRLKSG